MVGLTWQLQHSIIAVTIIFPSAIDSRETGFSISSKTVYFRLWFFLYKILRVQRGSEGLRFDDFGEFEGAQGKTLMKNPRACVALNRDRLHSQWLILCNIAYWYSGGIYYFYAAFSAFCHV